MLELARYDAQIYTNDAGNLGKALSREVSHAAAVGPEDSGCKRPFGATHRLKVMTRLPLQDSDFRRARIFSRPVFVFSQEKPPISGRPRGGCGRGGCAGSRRPSESDRGRRVGAIRI